MAKYIFMVNIFMGCINLARVLRGTLIIGQNSGMGINESGQIFHSFVGSFTVIKCLNTRQ